MTRSYKGDSETAVLSSTPTGSTTTTTPFSQQFPTSLDMLANPPKSSTSDEEEPRWKAAAILSYSIHSSKVSC